MWLCMKPFRCKRCGGNDPYIYVTKKGKFNRTCRPCGKIYKRKYDSKNNNNKIARSKKYSLKIRLEVLAAYGGKCSCCGESEPNFLAVDHINGLGPTKKRPGSGSNLYLWLRRNNYPKDNFQLLCHNCNSAKGFYGVCPHKRKNNVL